jgi:hypothetical protein
MPEKRALHWPRSTNRLAGNHAPHTHGGAHGSTAHGVRTRGAYVGLAHHRPMCGSTHPAKARARGKRVARSDTPKRAGTGRAVRGGRGARPIPIRRRAVAPPTERGDTESRPRTPGAWSWEWEAFAAPRARGASLREPTTYAGWLTSPRLTRPCG